MRTELGTVGLLAVVKRLTISLTISLWCQPLVVNPMSTQLLAGVIIPPKGDDGIIYKPPYLTYSYAPETPVLLEGSILKNLLLGVEERGGREAGTEEAWEIARRLGLPAEFLHAPDSFSVGKGGRNLSLSARQIISIARVILSSADVLMLHRPTAFLTAKESDTVLSVLEEYATCGGLWGMLDPSSRSDQGTSPSHYLTGNGMRTVILTMSHRDRNHIPSVVTRTVDCEAVFEAPEGAILRTPSVEDLSSQEFMDKEIPVSARLGFAEGFNEGDVGSRRVGAADFPPTPPASGPQQQNQNLKGVPKYPPESAATQRSREPSQQTLTPDEALRRLAESAESSFERYL